MPATTALPRLPVDGVDAAGPVLRVSPHRPLGLEVVLQLLFAVKLIAVRPLSSSLRKKAPDE